VEGKVVLLSRLCRGAENPEEAIGIWVGVVEEKCTYVMAVSGRIHYDTNKQTNKQLE